MATYPNPTDLDTSDHLSEKHTPIRDALDAEMEDAREKLSNAGSRTLSKAASFSEKMRLKAIDEADQRKDALAEGLHDIADSVRGSVREDTTGAALTGRLAREAADGLDNLSRSIQERSLVNAADDLRDIGRRHPLLFVAGGLLAGLTLARFLKASSDRAVEYEYEDDDIEDYHDEDSPYVDEDVGLDMSAFERETDAARSTSVLGTDDRA
ncbi:hypothetical protein [Rhizobium sp. EC-SD404]|uniref:hypothetical protein n=1 Tax=Rhizobium sp. EC-SD404 TaxID=2038389 RepID=UPI00125A607F|nr:hypothetical protein [Rhizobium sp. EC-SD404]VVT08683.1 hypothetical protein RHIZ404_200799 [Rhizobium sp. EC-SD404]